MPAMAPEQGPLAARFYRRGCFTELSRLKTPLRVRWPWWYGTGEGYGAVGTLGGMTGPCSMVTFLAKKAEVEGISGEMS
jgi:hypothetical protein